MQGNSTGQGGMCVYRLEPQFLSAVCRVRVQIANMQLFQKLLGFFPFKNSTLEQSWSPLLKLFLIYSVSKSGGATMRKAMVIEIS